MVSTPMLTTIWRQRWIRTVVCWVLNRSPADEAGFEELLAWLVGFGELLSWARRSQLESFIHLAKGSPNTAKRSTPTSTMVSPKDPSNRPTPKSGYSPGSRSGSTGPTPHRPRPTRSRQSPTTTPRPKMTHGYSRRARHVRRIDDRNPDH